MANVLDNLKGGDLRSIGVADKIVNDIFKNPRLFDEVFKGLLVEDSLVRMRAADIIEKVARKQPKLLHPYKTTLINKISKIEQQEVRWHLAQMFSYIYIDGDERNKIIKILVSYIKNDKSKIVKTFAVQTLADFAERDSALKPKIIKIIEGAQKKHKDSPAVLSRARKLLKKLKKSKAVESDIEE